MDTTPAAGLSPKVGLDLHFTVTGQGKCGQFQIDWGDGSLLQNVFDQDFAQPFYATHRYTAWGGGKTVTVNPISNCGGYARTRFTIAPTAPITTGWNRNPMGNVQTCNADPAAPGPLASHSLLHVISPPMPVVNFSCPFNGCIYDAGGRPNSFSTPPFPFPGMREYSLVIRVGTQVFQGGKDVKVTVPTGGTLEMCQNTDKPQTATGGWEVDFTVDELGP